MGSGFIGVDWEVDWGVVDTMLSSIALEVTGISQHFQKGVTDVTYFPLQESHPEIR